MVDLVGGAHAVVQAQHVVDRGEDIVHRDGAADQLVAVFAQQLLLLLRVGGGVQDLADAGQAGALVDAGLLLHVEAEEGLGVHTAVGDDDEGHRVPHLLVDQHLDAGDAGGVDLLGLGAVDLLAVCDQQLAGQRGDHILAGAQAGDAAGQRQLVVHLVAAKAGQVITAGVKEQRIQMAAAAFHRRGLAGAQLAVDFQQAFLSGVGDVLFQRSVDLGLGITEELTDLLVGAKAQRTHQRGDRQLAVFVDTDIENVLGIGLILQPGAAVGVHGSGKQVLAGAVLAGTVENAGRTDQLADDGALRTVGDKGAGIGHEREIAHEDLLLLHFPGLLVEQPRRDVQRGRVGGIPFLAFFDGVLGVLVQPVVDEFQHQVAGVVLDRGNVVEDFTQAFLQEPVVRIFLDLDEIGHVDHFVDPGKTHAGRSAVLYGLDLYHKTRPLLFHRLTKLVKATQKTGLETNHIRHFSQSFRGCRKGSILLGRSIPFL